MILQILGAAYGESVNCRPVDRVKFYEGVEGRGFAIELECAGELFVFAFPSSAYDDLLRALHASRATSEEFRSATRN